MAKMRFKKVQILNQMMKLSKPWMIRFEKYI